MKDLVILIIAVSLFSCDTFNQNSTDREVVGSSDKLLGAYYFGAGYFTLVPKNIRNDLDDMKSLGTDFICITSTKSDLRANRKNIGFIVDEAHNRGMKVFVVPSMVAGITAGQPLEPPVFPYHNPATWVTKRDGSKLIRGGGAMCSFYYPEVKEHFIEIAHKIMDTWDIDGIVWDEPKSTYIDWQDFSPLALKNNPDSSFVKYMEDFAVFFSDINKAIKDKDSSMTILFFDEACRNDVVPEKTATIKYLDYFGTDGHPYPKEKSHHVGNRAEKVLPVYGERFLKEGRKNGLKTFMLVENQTLTGDQLDFMEETFPDILKMDLDMMIYYYYGFYKDDTERNMDIIRNYVPKFKQ